MFWFGLLHFYAQYETVKHNYNSKPIMAGKNLARLHEKAAFLVRHMLPVHETQSDINPTLQQLCDSRYILSILLTLGLFIFWQCG